MDGYADIGFGPKILIAIQDISGITRIYTGIVREGSISIYYPHAEMRISDYTPPIQVRSGDPLAKLEVTFSLQYQGGEMKTWADIRTPEEITPSRKAIEE